MGDISTGTPIDTIFKDLYNKARVISILEDIAKK